ncbi:MAG: HU family DNA-binding protein [Verrucomicrobiales bacterium]|nr:HU family DNA-binding protein [Verrucomicrobiales bacterium]
MSKKIKALDAKLNRSQILQQIADNTELSKKQVASVLDELGDVIEGHLKKKAVGEFVLPGLLKIVTVRKPAVKARKGINPFTKEEQMFKAKPATTVVKVRPLKKLKDMAL